MATTTLETPVNNGVTQDKKTNLRTRFDIAIDEQVMKARDLNAAQRAKEGKADVPEKKPVSALIEEYNAIVDNAIARANQENIPISTATSTSESPTEPNPIVETDKQVNKVPQVDEGTQTLLDLFNAKNQTDALLERVAQGVMKKSFDALNPTELVRVQRIVDEIKHDADPDFDTEQIKKRKKAIETSGIVRLTQHLENQQNTAINPETPQVDTDQTQ
ncbi:MAG: hypothetical protein ABI425_05085 [Patescibacteria group bacterium]